MSVQEFPLYDTLQQLSLTTADMSHKTLCSTLSSLGKEDSEIVYAVLYHYHLLNGLPTANNLLKGRTTSANGGLFINMNSVPLDLQKILISFVKMKASP